MLLCLARERRPRFTAVFRFAHETVPKAPSTQAVAKLAQHKVHTRSIEEVKEVNVRFNITTQIVML